jgi:hypothetical protein
MCLSSLDCSAFQRTRDCPINTVHRYTPVAGFLKHCMKLCNIQTAIHRSATPYISFTFSSVRLVTGGVTHCQPCFRYPRRMAHKEWGLVQPFLALWPSTHPSYQSSIIHPSLYSLSIHPSIHPSFICLSICLSVCLSIYLSICPSVYLSVSVYLSICVCLIIVCNLSVNFMLT